jgi:hypothetical protein
VLYCVIFLGLQILLSLHKQCKYIWIGMLSEEFFSHLVSVAEDHHVPLSRSVIPAACAGLLAGQCASHSVAAVVLRRLVRFLEATISLC